VVLLLLVYELWRLGVAALEFLEWLKGKFGRGKVAPAA
jgi:hypothetical protein